MRPIAVVILAAGKGTRMKSELAKVLHPICGRPMIAYPLETALKLKPKRIVAVIGHQAEDVKVAIACEFPKAKIDYALQKTQDGTGHAVLQAKSALKDFKGDVLILSGDVPLLPAEMIKEFCKMHAKAKADVSVLSTIMEDPFGYGRCLADDDGCLFEIVEEKDATAEQREITEVNTGIYLINSELLWRALGKVGRNNAQGEIYLTDLIKLANEEGKTVRAFVGDQAQLMLGINSRLELAEATEVIRWRLLREFMRNGVTMLDPHTVYIDAGVKIGADTMLEPGIMLLGRTKIGAGCRIGFGSRLEDATIGDSAEIGPHSVLYGIKVKAGEIHQLFGQQD